MGTKPRNLPLIEANRPSSPAQRRSRLFPDPSTVVKTESEYAALSQWEQLWKDAVKKNETARLRTRSRQH